jgi:hypothetical protein
MGSRCSCGAGSGSGGEAGPAGPPGDSAYEIAVANGFVGNEAAWLLSLNVTGVTVLALEEDASTLPLGTVYFRLIA